MQNHQLTFFILTALSCLLQVDARADDRDLLAHWKLTGDARDSAGDHHGQAHEVEWTVDGARFDGRSSYIAAPHHPSLNLGSREFSITMRVHTAVDLDDALGDLVSKYDAKARKGFHFSIQNHAGVTSSQANYRHLHFGVDHGSTPGKWTDHGRLGNAVLIYGMSVHDNQLFVGTCEAGKGEAGRVFRYDGRQWTDCGAPDRCNSVSSLAVFRNKLYVGVSKYRLAGSSLTESANLNVGGKIYRYDGDDRWTLCGTLPEVEAINGLVVYRGRLYASSMYAPASFFRYEGGREWKSCGVPGGKRVEALTVYNGHIYATGYDEGAVYRYDGEQWKSLGVIEGASQTYGFATHRGQLFVSEWPNARVFRLAKDKWLSAGRLGDEKESMPLIVYNGKMYGGTLPSAEVYRYDQPNWTKIARLDFTPDVRYRRAWTMAVYRGRLFVGTLPSGHVHSIEIGGNVTYDRPLPSGWVSLAAVRAKSHLRLYVSGKRVATSSPLPSKSLDISNEKPMQIGRGAHDFFNGKLRDVRIYSRALTDEEVEKLPY